MRILVLDDEPARHSLFATAWKGHDITQAWTANEAIRALRAGPFDLVTLDHDLGPASDGDGLRVARKIASMPADTRPPHVLVHSANPVGAQAMVDTLQRAGIDAQRIDPLRLAASAA
jgi:CheY-like chemotaxis protein